MLHRASQKMLDIYQIRYIYFRRDKAMTFFFSSEKVGPEIC